MPGISPNVPSTTNAEVPTKPSAPKDEGALAGKKKAWMLPGPQPRAPRNVRAQHQKLLAIKEEVLTERRSSSDDGFAPPAFVKPRMLTVPASARLFNEAALEFVAKHSAKDSAFTSDDYVAVLRLNNAFEALREDNLKWVTVSYTGFMDKLASLLAEGSPQREEVSKALGVGKAQRDKVAQLEKVLGSRITFVSAELFNAEALKFVAEHSAPDSTFMLQDLNAVIRFKKSFEALSKDDRILVADPYRGFINKVASLIVNEDGSPKTREALRALGAANVYALHEVLSSLYRDREEHPCCKAVWNIFCDLDRD